MKMKAILESKDGGKTWKPTKVFYATWEKEGEEKPFYGNKEPFENLVLVNIWTDLSCV